MTSVLKTRRLKLRKFTQDDLDDLCRAPVPPSSVGRSRSRDRAANVRRIPPFQARPRPTFHEIRIDRIDRHQGGDEFEQLRWDLGRGRTHTDRAHDMKRGRDSRLPDSAASQAIVRGATITNRLPSSRSLTP